MIKVNAKESHVFSDLLISLPINLLSKLFLDRFGCANNHLNQDLSVVEEKKVNNNKVAKKEINKERKATNNKITKEIIKKTESKRRKTLRRVEPQKDQSTGVNYSHQPNSIWLISRSISPIV